MPNTKYVERQGAIAAPFVRRYPEVRGGVCEHCGVIDPNVPSKDQYKLCEHYRGQQLQCSYCPAEKDPDEVISRSAMLISDHPSDPNKLVVLCNSYECAEKHLDRFQTNR